MKTMLLPVSVPRLGFGLVRQTRLLLVATVLAALAVANRSAANPFATTTVTPSHQTDNAGTPSSFSLDFNIGSDAAYGIDATLKFDPTLIQITSITLGGSSPFKTVTVDSFNNTTGAFEFAATGPASSGNFDVATINFTPIAAGTDPIHFLNVIEDISGYGPYGVNGLSVDGSVTVQGSLSVPDVSSTLILLGTGLLALAVLGRRFIAAPSSRSTEC
jgi:hypothetical protein